MIAGFRTWVWSGASEDCSVQGLGFRACLEVHGWFYKWELEVRSYRL